MLDDARPDPNELLRQMQPEKERRGKLKIFFGYAAGVGKTYAMLEAAHAAKEQGVDEMCIRDSCVPVCGPAER